MALCAVYAFVFCGKKKSPLLGVSAAIFAGSYIYFTLENVVDGFRYEMWSEAWFTYSTVSIMLFAIIFTMITVKLFSKKTNNNAQVVIFSAIALVFSIVSNFISVTVFLYDRTFGVIDFINMIIWSIYIAPFLLLSLYSRANSKVVDDG